MQVSIFDQYGALNSAPVFAAVRAGLDASGIAHASMDINADVAVIWSALWQGRMARNKTVYEHYRSQGKPVIIIDVGALYRGNTWKISVNNITANGYYGHQENLDLDRPRKLGISLATQIQPNPYILIAAQHNQSLQLEGITIENCISQQIEQN